MAATSDVRLDELLDGLGIESLQVMLPGAALDVAVKTVVIGDVEALESVTPGAFVLAPGMAAHALPIVAALERVRAAGAAALAIRAGIWRAAVEPSDVSRVAFPVVGVPDGIGWGELYEMLTAVLASSGRLPSQHSDRPLARLFSFADAVAVALGGPVMIEDPQAQVLAYSNVEGQVIDAVREEAILTRRVPLTERNRAEYLELSRTGGPVRFNAEGAEMPRLAIAVRAGDQILGFLWAIAHPGTLVGDASERIVDAARLASIELVRARAMDDVGRRTRDDALRRLLEGERDIGLRTAVGLERADAVGVLAAARVPSPSVEDEPVGTWLPDFLALSARVRFQDARCVTSGDVCYVVIATSRERLGELAALGQTILQRSAVRGNLQIGVGTATAIDDLGAARLEADQALHALASRDAEPAVATIEDVRSLAILVELGELAAERPSLLAGPVQALLDTASRAPSWGLGTLQAYFACFGILTETAAMLGIHPNTLRYRLNRIAELLQIDLGDPDERLVLALQLRLLAPGVGFVGQYGMGGRGL